MRSGKIFEYRGGEVVTGRSQAQFTDCDLFFSLNRLVARGRIVFRKLGKDEVAKTHWTTKRRI